ncbi:MAG: Uma2 family endonuclease [Bacteroidota bacterium]
MATTNLRQKWTYDEMVEKLPAESRYEIINGELNDMSPAPSPEHQSILKKLFKKLDSVVESLALGEVSFAPYDVILDQNNVVQPDIFFVSKENTGKITKKGFGSVPDLVVEILSPSSYYRDTVEKKDLYERFGVKEYWIIDPANRVIEVFTLQENKYQLHVFVAEEGKVTSVVLAGFEADINDIFGHIQPENN